MEYKDKLDREDKELYCNLLNGLGNEESFNKIKNTCMTDDEFCTQCLQTLYNGGVSLIQYLDCKQGINYALLRVIFSLCKNAGIIKLGGMKLDFSILEDEDKCDKFICNLLEYIADRI